MLPSIVESQERLSDRLCVFRTVESTIYAIKLVTCLTENVIHGKGTTSKYYVVLTKDMKNAFNLANWRLIKKSLTSKGVSNYIACCLQEQVFCNDTNVGAQEYIVPSGVPQGSILGPLL